MPRSESDSSDENPVGLTEKRKAFLSKALDGQGKKKQSAEILRPYTKLARWWTRSENLFVNWYDVLDKGLAWMGRSFGEYSQAAFKKKYFTEIETYGGMALGIKCFEQDLPYFEDPENVERKDDLAKAMVAASAAARSEDISSLSKAILIYIEEADPDNDGLRTISARTKKSESHGFKHPILGRLLCPIRHINDFDKDPAEFLKKLDNGSVKVRSRDLPSFIWPNNGYDPEQMDANMFRSPVLVMVWKHIFTCPSSALKDGPGQTKTRSSQAKVNKMTSVTPGSIAYAAIMLRHSISTVDDWRIDDKLFNREEFYKQIMDTFKEDDDVDLDWVKDTIEWWNTQVFGTESKSIDDSDNEQGPSTIAIIKAQRRAQKAQKVDPVPADQPPAARNAAPPGPVPIKLNGPPLAIVPLVFPLHLVAKDRLVVDLPVTHDLPFAEHRTVRHSINTDDLLAVALVIGPLAIRLLITARLDRLRRPCTVVIHRFPGLPLNQSMQHLRRFPPLTMRRTNRLHLRQPTLPRGRACRRHNRHQAIRRADLHSQTITIVGKLVPILRHRRHLENVSTVDERSKGYC